MVWPTQFEVFRRAFELSVFLEGFLLQASLILALGAQNLFVLESGLKKERYLYIAFLCSLCDTVLILIGVLGAASIFVKWPLFKAIFGALGVGFLLFYGLVKIREAMRVDAEPTSREENETATLLTLKKATLLTLGFSLLNPHVYLDTIILIGGYSAKFSAFEKRVFFGGGAAAFSTLWFFSLAMGSSLLSPVIHNKKSMIFINWVSGAILVGLAYILGQDVYRWIIDLF